MATFGSGDKTRAQKIANILASHGWSKNAIKGALANGLSESHYNKNALNPSSGTRGIWQWSSGSFAHIADPGTLEGQTEAINKGLGWQTGRNGLRDNFEETFHFKQYKKSTLSAKTLTKAFFDNLEIAGYWSSNAGDRLQSLKAVESADLDYSGALDTSGNDDDDDNIKPKPKPFTGEKALWIFRDPTIMVSAGFDDTDNRNNSTGGYDFEIGEGNNNMCDWAIRGARHHSQYDHSDPNWDSEHNPGITDCSGFVSWCLYQATNHKSKYRFDTEELWADTTYLDTVNDKLTDLKPGDVLVWKLPGTTGYAHASHVSIYLGKKKLSDLDTGSKKQPDTTYYTDGSGHVTIAEETDPGYYGGSTVMGDPDGKGAGFRLLYNEAYLTRHARLKPKYNADGFDNDDSSNKYLMVRAPWSGYLFSARSSKVDDQPNGLDDNKWYGEPYGAIYVSDNPVMFADGKVGYGVMYISGADGWYIEPDGYDVLIKQGTKIYKSGTGGLINKKHVHIEIFMIDGDGVKDKDTIIDTLKVSSKPWGGWDNQLYQSDNKGDWSSDLVLNDEQDNWAERRGMFSLDNVFDYTGDYPVSNGGTSKHGSKLIQDTIDKLHTTKEGNGDYSSGGNKDVEWKTKYIDKVVWHKSYGLSMSGKF